jgi:hypothetical protein
MALQYRLCLNRDILSLFFVIIALHMLNIYQVADGVKPVKRERRVIRGKSYWVHYVDGRTLENAGLNLFGYVHKHNIYVRIGLPKHVEHGVLTHEAYHYGDTKKWLGMYGMEIRANAFTIFHDPIGFLATAIYSLNTARIKTYWKL